MHCWMNVPQSVVCIYCVSMQTLYRYRCICVHVHITLCHYTRYEPTLDIHKENIKKDNKHMPFVMNIAIMYHILNYVQKRRENPKDCA